jgi:hypothetical protein
MQPAKNPDETILDLEAEIDRLAKLLDKSITDKEDLEKTKEIFHELKILSDKLAELKAPTQYKKVARVNKKMRIKSATPLQKQAS